MEKESKTGCIEQLRTKCGCERAAQDKKTLRDYFAAKAMQAIISRNKIMLEGHWQDRVAIDAYAMADAMIAQRENLEKVND